MIFCYRKSRLKYLCGFWSQNHKCAVFGCHSEYKINNNRYGWIQKLGDNVKKVDAAKKVNIVRL